MVCSSPQQADGACATPTVTKRSSRIPRQTPVAATAGSESGEKKPKHATNAAECEAKIHLNKLVGKMQMFAR